MIIYAICRNFGGKRALLASVIQTMLKELKKGGQNRGKEKEEIEENEMGVGEVRYPPLSRLIVDNVSSSSSRHLMLLTKNCSALWLLFGCGMVERENAKVIIGSDFVEDKSELFIIQQLNEVFFSLLPTLN